MNARQPSLAFDSAPLGTPVTVQDLFSPVPAGGMGPPHQLRQKPLSRHIYAARLHAGTYDFRASIVIVDLMQV